MEILLKNVPVLLVFLTLSVTAWLWGGARGDILLPVVPWLWALLVEVLVCFPQRHHHESAVTARSRVWHGLKKDPLLYFSLGFALLLVLPFANPFVPQHGEAQLAWAPFCVQPSEHLGTIFWFLPALTAMLATRHSLSHQGKRLLVELFAWNGAALAVLGFVQRGTEAAAPFWTARPIAGFFSTFGYPNMGGAYFVFAFACAVGVWLQHVRDVGEEPVVHEKGGSHSRAVLDRIIRSHYIFPAVAFNFFGAMCTLSRAAIVLLFTLAALAFVYVECSLLFATSHRAKRIRSAAVVLAVALGCLWAAYIFAPEGIARELETVSTAAVCDRVTGKAQYHTRVAMSIFKDHPFFGVGGWGYRHFSYQYLTKDERKQMQTVGGANVHNDYMQFLCEYGTVGAIMLLGVFFSLIVPIFRSWHRLNRTAHFMNSSKSPAKPRAIYCLPPAAFWIVIGCIALMIHAFGDCPLRSTAVLSAFLCMLACTEGFIPREEEKHS